jgi:putative heme-binding domain-containing protein
MPVALKIGPDGCLYVLDWYDRYHCSQDAARDPAGVDRLKGRLYRLRHGETPRAKATDLAKQTDDGLLAHLASGNIYLRETAQRILTERLGGDATELRNKIEMQVLASGNGGGNQASLERQGRLHALWSLVGSGRLETGFHLNILAHPDPACRAWGVRAAGNFETVSPLVQEKVAMLARDPSPDVQLQVAIASRKIKGLDALPVLTEVLRHCGQDKIIPSILWHNLHPLLETSGARFVRLQTNWSPALGALSARVVERILSAPLPNGQAVATFVKLAASHDGERAKDCLSAISLRLGALNESETERLKLDLQPVLSEFLGGSADAPYFVGAQLLAARLGIARIEAAAIRERFTSTNQLEASRLQALDAIIAFRDPQLLAVLPEVLSSGSPQFLRRIFAALGRMEDPKLASVVLAAYPRLAPELQPLAVDLLMQRERWARQLLDAVLADKLPKAILNANHLRKILESNDRDALWAVEKAFGKVREERNPERERVVAEMDAYLHEHKGDPHRGQVVFRNLCGQCHTIYDEGGKIGPDITANGRASFEQLLSNVLDPSLVIGPAYQVTTVVTKDGRNLTGLIAEDNEQRVVIRMPGEGEETVPRNNVKYLRVSRLSMMPEGLEELIPRQGLSDLFAFLSLDKPPADPSARVIPGAPLASWASTSDRTGSASRIKVERTENRLTIRARTGNSQEWVDLATYVMEAKSRPYLHPVRDGTGKMVLTEDRPADHPWQHGIFTGFHRVNGFNYWKEDEGRQRFVRLLDLREGPDRISWRALIELVAPDGTVVLEEEEAITIHAPETSDAYRIDFEILLRTQGQQVTFGKFFVGGLSVRMPWDKANPRQTHLNSNGLRDRQCEQQRAAWCNVERPFDGAVFGIAVFDHPANANHPSGWRADEQGLINPNVSALGDWTLPARQTRRFNYRLLIYRGPATKEQLRKEFDVFASGSDSASRSRPAP